MFQMSGQVLELWFKILGVELAAACADLHRQMKQVHAGLLYALPSPACTMPRGACWICVVGVATNVI